MRPMIGKTHVVIVLAASGLCKVISSCSFHKEVIWGKPIVVVGASATEFLTSFKRNYRGVIRIIENATHTSVVDILRIDCRRAIEEFSATGSKINAPSHAS